MRNPMIRIPKNIFSNYRSDIVWRDYQFEIVVCIQRQLTAECWSAQIRNTVLGATGEINTLEKKDRLTGTEQKWPSTIKPWLGTIAWADRESVYPDGIPRCFDSIPTCPWSHGTCALNRGMQSRNIGIYRRHIQIPISKWNVPSLCQRVARCLTLSRDPPWN